MNISKIIKAFKNPKLAFRVLFSKIRYGKNYYIALVRAKMNGTYVKIGDGNCFVQKVLFTGKGKITLGNKNVFGVKNGGKYYSNYCEIQARYEDSKIVIGSNVAVNNGLLIIAAKLIEIGDYCLIGKDVQLIDFDAHGLAPFERRSSIGKVRPIKIGSNVWLGNNVIILKGTEIGENSVVGAGSVVTGGKFPANVVIAGNPAKIIKSLDVI